MRKGKGATTVGGGDGPHSRTRTPASEDIIKKQVGGQMSGGEFEKIREGEVGGPPQTKRRGGLDEAFQRQAREVTKTSESVFPT